MEVGIAASLQEPLSVAGFFLHFYVQYQLIALMGTNEASGVLIADVVASRDKRNFRTTRDYCLAKLSKALRGRLIRTDFAVSGYDEFQCIGSHPACLPDLVWEVRREFHPWSLRIGLGIGRVDVMPDSREVNETSTGEAFFRARAALEAIQQGKGKYDLWTRLSSDMEPLDLTANLVYGLLDSMLARNTDRQWQTIKAFEQDAGLAAAAKRLEVDTSTISRNLQRASYWQVAEARKTLRALINLHLGIQNSIIASGDTR